MSEPTIDKALHHLRIMEVECATAIKKECLNLAIRALEEMAEKHAPAKIISQDGGKGWSRCNEAEFVPHVTTDVLWPKDKPLTWRDVTVKELLDHRNKCLFSRYEIIRSAREIVESTNNPFPEPRLGRELPKEEP